MKETEIIELKKFKLKNAILITGLPGVGLIGQTVGKYLVDELKAEKVAYVLSPHFPHQVIMTRSGKPRIVKNRIYVVKGSKRDLMFLLGDVQAITSVGQYEVAGKILDYAIRKGVKEILTVGGYSIGRFEDKKRAHAVTTSDKIKKKLSKLGVVFGEAKGSIVGAAGLLPVLAKARGLEGTCLMGETHGGYADTSSAKKVLEIISKYLGLKVDLKRIGERAKESQKMIKNIQEEMQKALEQGVAPDVSYIR